PVQVGVRDGVELAQVEGELDVLGGEGLTVVPGDALAEGDHELVVGHPLAALGEPRLKLYRVGVEQEQGLVDETHGPGRVAAGGERVPVRVGAPLRTGGEQGLFARELARVDVFAAAILTV